MGHRIPCERQSGEPAQMQDCGSGKSTFKNNFLFFLILLLPFSLLHLKKSILIPKKTIEIAMTICSDAHLWMFKLLALISCSLASLNIAAQSDTIVSELSIPEALVLEKRFSTAGFTIWQADSLPTAAVLSLSNRLFWENGLDLRQNAPGTLATLSARGAGPNRTAVFWNGLSLQSPMNGVVDASLLPLWNGDRLAVLQGGNSAAQSSGAMGGTVLIETPFEQNEPGLYGQLAIGGGSFAQQSAQGSAELIRKKTASRIRANWQSAENNFPFQAIALNGQSYKSRQQNNFAEKIDIQQFNRFVLHKKHVLKTAAWYQHAFRQIPPAITEATANTWQRDWSARAVATWEFNPQKHFKLQSRIAWQDEFIAFHFAGKTEESRAQTALLGSEWRQQTGRGLEWKLGATAQQIRAVSDGYQIKGKWYAQARLAGYTQVERSFGASGKFSALLRQEWVEALAAPFTWTLGWELPTGKRGMLRGHVSRNFNLPTFNDRFWETLDKSQLKPEKGYSADFGWAFKRRRFAAEITAFQLLLDDWILWQPSPQDGIFRPGNLRKVNSRGLEASSSLAFKCMGVQWRAKAHLQWSATENAAVYGGAESVLGKQLPYTPRVSAGGGLWAIVGGLSGAYLHQFTGKRFVSSDNMTLLPDFQTGTLLLCFSFRGCPRAWVKGLAVDFRLENIWDVQYQSLANRPMPGRNWRLEIRHSF